MGFSAYGQTSHIIKSLSTGQDIYEVVYGKKSSKDLKHGIYGINPKTGEVYPIILGDVLGANRGFNGIYTQVPDGIRNSPSPVVSIVDGRVVILNRNSKEESRESYIVLGSVENPVVDILQGRAVKMSPITSRDSVSMYLGDAYQASSGKVAFNLFISVDQKNSLGTGYTFVVPLFQSEAESDSIKIMRNKPVLVSYDFYSETDLRSLSLQDSYVLSPILAENLKSRLESEGRHEITEGWIQILEDFLAGRKNTQKGFALPQYNLQDGKVSISDRVVSQIVANNGTTFIQAYDPLKDEWQVLNLDSNRTQPRRFFPTGIYVPEADLKLYTPLLAKVRRGEEGKGYRVVQSAVTPDDIFIATDTTPIFLLNIKNAHNQVFQKLPVLIEGNLEISDAEKFSFVRKELTYQGATFHFIFISYITKKNVEKTQVIYIRQTGSALTHEKTFDLMGGFMTEKELAHRIYLNSKGQLLFDNVNKIHGAEEYEAAHTKRRLAPHLNLNQAIDRSQPAQVYVHEKREEIIIPSVLYFREYSKEGASGGTHTGFYTHGNSSQFIPGEIIFKTQKDGLNSYIMDEAKLHFETAENKSMPSTKVSVFPYAPADDKGFSIGVVVSAGYGDNPIVRIQTKRIGSDKSELIGLQVIQEKRKKERNFVVLVFLKGKDGTTNRMYSLHYSLGVEGLGSSTGETKFSIHENLVRGFEVAQISERDLKERIKIDVNGNLYWAVDASKSKSDKGYIIASFSEEKQFMPNRDRDVQIRHDESVFSNEKKDYTFGGRWLISSKTGLFTREPSIEKILEQTKALIKKGDIAPHLIFAGLPQFLDSSADASSKSSKPKRQVILVEEPLKEEFVRAFYHYLMESDSEFTLDSSRARNFDFYLMDETSSASEIRAEFKKIRERSASRTALLVSDLGKILQSGEILEDKSHSLEAGRESDEQRLDEVRALEDASAKQEAQRLSRLLLLATDGQAYSLKDFRDNKDTFRASVPMFIFATPKEWQTAQQIYKSEFEVGLGAQFEVNHHFYTSPWTVWRPGTKKTSPVVKEMAENPISIEEQKIFPSLDQLLIQAARGIHKGKQIILVVPEGIKPLVDKLILSRWASSNKEVAGLWNYSNQDLSLFKISGNRDANTQSMVLSTLEAMSSVGKTNNVVLYADMDAILKIQRPTVSDVSTAYLLEDPNGKTKEAGGLYSGEKKVQAGQNRGVIEPHMAWLLASEGNRIPISNAKDWDLKRQYEGRYATIILATEAELTQLETEMTFESKFFDFKRHYEMVKFDPPTDKLKFDLLASLLNRSEIRSLEYEFSVPGTTSEEAKRQLLAHIINRTNQIAETKGKELTAAFIRVFSEFRRVLMEDVELRRTRIITKNYVDRFFSKVFPMPLNPDILAEQDPLKRLTRTERIVREWRESGYEGSNDLKTRVIQTVLGQTRPTDTGKPIPSSIILFGGTSSGKTFLAESLFKLLNIKTYDFTKSSNEDAEAIIIRVSNIVQNDAEATGSKMTVEQVIEHIENLLAQPKGYRSWILFDDIHKAGSAEIYQTLMTFIQGLFDSDNGMIRVRKRQGDQVVETRDIPVQNLNVLLTLNPESDKDVIKRFAESEKDLKGQVLAALSKHNVKIETSFLARWADIINLDAFPRSAKVPALVSRVREQSQQLSHIVLAERDAINKIVDAYPKANAREFLSPAATAMTTVPVLARPANLYIVTPNDATPSATTEQRVDSFGLSKVVRELTNITAVTRDDLGSQLKLISFISNNFRTNLFNHIVLEAEGHPILNLDVAGFGSLIRKNFVFAMATHTIEQTRMPTSEITIRRDEMPHLSKVQYEELYQLQKSQPGTDFFPFKFSVREVSLNFDPSSFLGKGTTSQEKSQNDVMSDYTLKVESILNRALRLFMRLHPDTDLKMVGVWSEADMRAWFDSLSNNDPTKELKLLSQELIALFKDFQIEMLDPNLVKSLPVRDALNHHDLSKLYSYVIDKAITRLPWGLASKFIMDIADISRDIGLGQKPAFINYTFKNTVSLFAISTVDVLTDLRLEMQANAENSRIISTRPLEFSMERYLRTPESTTCQVYFR